MAGQKERRIRITLPPPPVPLEMEVEGQKIRLNKPLTIELVFYEPEEVQVTKELRKEVELPRKEE